MMLCFFHHLCAGVAELEKQGKTVCRACASAMKGVEYPLRVPSIAPLFTPEEEKSLTGQMGMREARARNHLAL